MKITIEDDDGLKCTVEKSGVEKIDDVMDLFRCGECEETYTDLDEILGELE